ncbi:MAG: TolC family protein [Candidatus Zixiibacteriota bacterium]
MQVSNRPRMAVAIPLIFLLVARAVPAGCREITLEEAIELAVGRTSRAEIIQGNLEVAERKYFGERVNFYLPEISVNGDIPAYRVDESFRFFGGANTKQLFKTTDLDFTGNIQLLQNLITGGQLTVRGNLYNKQAEYPLTNQPGTILNETTREGDFDFEFVQPLLQPSDAINDLNNSRDDLEIARLDRGEQIASLKKEVTEAYFGVLQTALKFEIAQDRLKSAGLQAEIDSVKLQDGVMAEEGWLESASVRLDAELEQFDISNQRLEKNRELAILLDLDATETLETTPPAVAEHLGERHKAQYINRWEESVDVRKAYYEYQKEQRAADFAASGRGLNADLKAAYSLGRGNVETKGYPQQDIVDRDIETNSWQVSLNFTYPIWDGGASSAAVQAARLAEEQKRIEFERVKRSARAEIINLINRLDVSYRKLEVLDQQVDLAGNRLDIAKFRFDDGQISEVKYLESKVDYLEARDKYLEELKNYLLDRITLEGKYSA